MGSCRRRSGDSRYSLQFFISTFLLLATARRAASSAEGRILLHDDSSEVRLRSTQQDGGELPAAVRSLIGSRPPRCDYRCLSCGRCEAVQVPAVPQTKNDGAERFFFARVSSSGGDDRSNYKPMSWKCKCGDMIFNP